MKKLSISITQVLCLLLVVVLTSCGEKKQESKEEKNKHPEKEAEEVKPPSDIISLEEADSLYINYSKHRVSIIEIYETQQRSPKEAFEASRFVDFDYDTIKKYIAYVDQEAGKAGVKKVTKLRLYFANYSKAQNFPDGKKVIHPRQNSIFMVPTLEKDGKNYGFFISEDGKPELIIDWRMQLEKGMGHLNKDRKTSYASMVPNNFSLNSSLAGGTSLALNHGHGGPPPAADFE